MMRKKTAVLFLLMALLLNGCGVQQNSVAVVALAAKEETMQIAQEEMEQPLEQPAQQIEVTELQLRGYAGNPFRFPGGLQLRQRHPVGMGIQRTVPQAAGAGR